MISIKLNNLGMSDTSYKILERSISRKLEERDIELALGNAVYTVNLIINCSYKNDRYTIEPQKDSVILTAANDCDLHAATGRFLLESNFNGRGGFEPCSKNIDFTPIKSIRGMYFATHFHNFYHAAPIEEVYSVVEDLALRGCNSLLVWFDMHHYSNMHDPEAQKMVERLRAILKYANKIGISGALTMLSNEDFEGSPEELRAEWHAQGGYHTAPYDHYHLEICPNKEGGIEEILRVRREMLSYFSDIDIKYVVYWPYDQGGCTCDKCQPWGSNGFLKLLPHFRELLNEMMPKTKIIVSTWYFDRFIDGEWNEFYPHLSDGSLNGVDYIMSFFFNGEIPDCIKKNGIPDGVRLVDFPEISMYSCSPWGGFGASVLSRFLQRTNKKSGYLYSGGYPYSEGIFEDLNKFIQLSYYTGLYTDAADAVRAYAKYEFCCDDDTLIDAIIRTETGLARGKSYEHESYYYPISDTSDIEYVYNTLTKYNDTLPEKIRKSYHFRLFYLRAIIDYEMMNHEFFPLRSARCQEAMQEINSIYYTNEKTKSWVSAPFGK